MATTNKTPPKPQAIPTVADAEAVISRLQISREQVVAERAKAEAETGRHAFAAHAQGDQAAVAELDKVAEVIMRHDQKLREIDLALAEAGRMLQQARQAEAAEQDHKAARRLREVARRMKQRGKNLDAALAIVIDELVGLQADVSEIHGSCGSQFPSHQQRDVFSYYALLTALKRTSFDRRFEPISSTNHVTFRALTASWGVTLEKNVATRLGEAEQPTEAA
jgi:hypothetical protein